METPEKIYLSQERDEDGCYIDLMWHKHPYEGKENIQYVRTDVFINKACEFLDGCVPDYIDLKHANVDTFMNVDNKRFIEDFKKYIQGE